EIGMGRGGIEIEVRLLHILAVVPFGAGQSEEPLLEDRIAPVPQCESEAKAPLAVADAEQTVFSPSVGPASRLVVREVVPHVAVRRVVLADRAPLALGQVGSPSLPVAFAATVLREPPGFRFGHEMSPDASCGSRPPSVDV